MSIGTGRLRRGNHQSSNWVNYSDCKIIAEGPHGRERRVRSVFAKSLLGVGASRLRTGTGPFPVNVIFVFSGEVAGVGALTLDAGKRALGVYD